MESNENFVFSVTFLHTLKRVYVYYRYVHLLLRTQGISRSIVSRVFCDVDGNKTLKNEQFARRAGNLVL